ncbi:MAG: sugar phosphate nucleotidyltransferase [Bryobacteraceae bacterium]
MSRHFNGQHRYCVILAGGDGTRLRQLTQCVSADARPKQFCPFLRGWTPLRATRQRAARSFDPERTLFVVTRAHEPYYTDALADVGPWQVLIQPDNKGTAPAILLSLLHLNRLDPEASVVFLPSDHHYLDERGFLDAVHRAFEAGDERTQPAVLLGASPTHPEVGYGWIEPGTPVETAGRGGLFRVMRFWEKPSLPVAKVLLNLGCLWNTFVMVGRVRTLLGLIQAATPQLYGNFQHHETTSGHFDSERLYETLAPVDFSRDVLAQSPAELAVLDAGSVGWSDLGEPERVVRLIAQLDSQCDWLDTWRRSRNYAS